jgi:hypothetical protein
MRCITSRSINAEEYAKKLGRETEKAGMSGARGLLYMSQAIDDIQYGFTAIVNNIPQIVMGFGGGAGIAGAVGIAAVAINQLQKHWGDFFGEAANYTTQLSANLDAIPHQLKRIDEAISEMDKKWEGKIMPLLEEEKLGRIKAVAREGHQRLADEKLIEGVGGDETAKIAAAVKKAMGQVGGAEEVESYLVERGVHPDKARKMVAGAIRGNAGFLDDILGHVEGGPAADKFSALFDATPEVLRANEADKARMRAMKAAEEAKKERDRNTDRLNEMGRAQQKAGQLEVAHQAQEDLQKRIRSAERMMPHDLVARAQALAEGIPQQVKPSEIMSTKQFADKMLTAGMNAVPQKQLDNLVKMLQELKTLNREIKRVGALE